MSPTALLSRLAATGRPGLRCLVASLALASAACLTRSETDLSGRPLGSSGGSDSTDASGTARPNPYADDPALAPIVGGVASPNDASGPDGTAAPTLGDNANVVDFVAASALFVDLSSNGNATATTSGSSSSGGGTTVYVYAQASACTDVTPQRLARQGLVLQLQLPGTAAAGSYQVVATAADVATASLGANQAAATLLNGGTALLRGATGTLVLGARSAAGVAVESATLRFAGGQSLTLGQLQAAPCTTQGTDAKDPNAPFVVASAYFAPATDSVAPILTLLDTPLSCAELRASNVVAPAGTRLLRVYVGDAQLNGAYAVVDTNGVGTGGVTAGKAAARYLKPAVSAIATSGTLTLQGYVPGSQLAGSLNATFNDGSRLSALPFTAFYCP